MKAVFLFFSLLADILIFLAGLAILALVLKVVGSVFSFVAVNLKSMFIACFIIYVFLLYSLNCTPHKISFFYDLITICTKQSNS
jgi:hypothetical protein